MKKILIATAAAIAMSGAASAADMSMPLKARPAPAPVYSWTGCYIDGGGGGAISNQSHYNFVSATGAPNTAEQTTGGRGWYGEVGGGCDYQFSMGNWGNFVVGVLGGYDFMSVKGAYTDPFLGNFSGYEKETGSGFAGARLGYLVTPNVLTYTSVGWTDARFNGIAMATPGAVATVFLPSQTYNGWFVGGGFETPLSAWFGLPSGLFLRTDYRYATYNAANLSYTTAAGVPLGVSTRMNKYVQTLGTEVVWRFNWH